MGVADVTDPGAVEAAMDEFDALGREAFLERHGFGPAREFFIVRDGRLYDSKAILGAAHAFQLGSPLPRTAFSGGAQTTNRLRALGFPIFELTPFSTDGGRVFGHVPGYPPGSSFVNRTELSQSGVHRPRQAGISGSAAEGADSIVVSGGYEDDEDYGDVIIYTGHGGNDPAMKKQIADQEFTRGNLGLAKSADEGLPVRVVRGAGGDPAHSPASGFRYDGLYRVEQYWHKTGVSGYRIYQYRLVRIEDAVTSEQSSPAEVPAPRVEASVQRIVRNTAVAQRVKALHGHACQVCGIVLETPSGRYAEGAHIKPLGRPHDGPDVEENILCLCANHHVLFDAGALVVDDDLQVVETASGQAVGPLRIGKGHRPDPAHLEYHRTTIPPQR